MMKRVVGIKVAASRFATGAESVARSSIYSKAYTEGPFKPYWAYGNRMGDKHR